LYFNVFYCILSLVYVSRRYVLFFSKNLKQLKKLIFNHYCSYVFNYNYTSICFKF